MDSATWILASGVLLLGAWLLNTHLGRAALTPWRARRHRMEPVAPLALLLFWMLPPDLLDQATAGWREGLPAWQGVLCRNLILFGWGVVVIATVLIYARLRFARGLRGLGLRVRGLGRDFVAAGAGLLAVWPLVVTMLLLVTWVGRQVQGPDYEVQAHEGLRQLAAYPRPLLAVVIGVMAVAVAPLSEELIFRGIVQTLLGSAWQRPWAAIAATSLLFALVHGNPTHWPALFVLSMGLGYVYERSGSLWRSVFMHALFNGITIASNLWA